MSLSSDSGDNKPKSPCINHCVIKPPNPYCLGCSRTIEEIADWSKYSNIEKQRIIESCKERNNA